MCVFLKMVCVELENNASLKAPSCSLLHITPITTAISLSLPFIPLFLPSISVSSPVRAVPSLTALNTNSRSLSPLYGDFLFSTSSLTLSLTLSLSLSLVVGVGCGDHSTAFPASLLSGGDDNDGRNKGWRNGGVERGKWRNGVLFLYGCQRLH